MLIRLIPLFFISFFACDNQVHAQRTTSADSIKNEILNLRLEVANTQNNLRLYSQSFKRGILTSAIGYSIVIIGGVLLGTDNLSDWGQPLIFAGGVVGFTGGIMLYRSHRHLATASKPLSVTDTGKAPN